MNAPEFERFYKQLMAQSGERDEFYVDRCGELTVRLCRPSDTGAASQMPRALSEPLQTGSDGPQHARCLAARQQLVNGNLTVQIHAHQRDLELSKSNIEHAYTYTHTLS